MCIVVGAAVLYEESSTGTVVLSNIQCNGSETDLLQCKYDVNDGRCEDHAGVICQGVSIIIMYTFTIC